MSRKQTGPLAKGEVRYLGHRSDLRAGLFALRGHHGTPPRQLLRQLTAFLSQPETADEWMLRWRREHRIRPVRHDEKAAGRGAAGAVR